MSFTTPSRSSVAILLAATCLPILGCNTPAEWSAAADDEVYQLVAERRAELGLLGSFTIEGPDASLRQRVIAGERPSELDSLSLADCQRFAAENSRDYQTRRESLYFEALDLSLERYLYGLHWDVSGSTGVSGTENGADAFDLDGGISLTRVLGNGADVVLNIGASFFKSLANGSPGDLISDLSLSITRPLIGAASNEAIFEPLTRAERSVVDEARRYERFRRSFGVDVFSRFWRILEQHEVVANEQSNVNNLGLLRERNEALTSAGRMDDIQAGQATQDELRAKSRLINAEAQLEGLYDDFKFFMGLPIDLEIRLDRTAFRAMADEGIEPVGLNEEQVIDLALVGRLDLATSRDRLSDAERALRISEENLGTQMDLTIQAGATGDVEPGFDIPSADLDWSVGLDYDLPIDRLAERNSFRAAELALDAAKRSLDQDEDQLRIDVRDDLRTLEQASEDYKIQVNSVLLAERRVESTELKLDAGRAETRDLLEARDSLVAAQNAVVSALVDYKLARLRLLLDMEELEVDDHGVRARDPELLTPQAAEEK